MKGGVCGLSGKFESEKIEALRFVSRRVYVEC